MRFATWNVNSVGARLPRLLDWLQTAEPDVLCLQETKAGQEAFPTGEVSALGYQTAHWGTGRWNGVAILSRVGLDEVTRGFPGQPEFAPQLFGAPAADDGALMPAQVVGELEPRAVGATCAGLRIWSLYVPNGRSVDDPHYAYKLDWLTALRAATVDELAAGRPFALTGDFNIAPTDDDVWDASKFVGSTHVTGPERQALADLREAGLVDVVPRAMKHDTPYSYWDYRAGAFHKNMGMRIDLVYANSAVADRVSDAYVDRDARKGSGPSDHAPVVVDWDG